MKGVAKKLLSFSAITVLLSSLALTDPAIWNSSAETTTYQASTAFSNGLGIQGKEQWYYQSWNGTSYTNLTWDSSTPKWYSSQTTYLAVTGLIMHPETSYDAVRKWVAPCDGTARIYGNVKKADTSGGDGVSVQIMLNDTSIWGQYHILYNDTVGLNYDLTETVKAGDVLYFRLNKYNSIDCDSTAWNPSIDFSPSSSGTNALAFDFTSDLNGWNSPYNCTLSTTGGYINGAISSGTPGFYSPSNLNVDITKNCILKIRLKNNTSGTYGAIYFRTYDDTNWTQPKCLAFTINPNDSDYTEYTVDMSGTYGWTGKLYQICVNPTYAISGSFSIDYIYLQSGGTNEPPFSLLQKEVIYNNSTLASKGLYYYPDSSFGVIRNSDASYKFLTSGSNGGSGQCAITSGTLDDPANTTIGYGVAVSNKPSDFQYVSTGPVYQDPSDSNTLISFLHLERHYTCNGAGYFYASLGIGISTDGGSSWTWCGEIIQPTITYSTSTEVSLDIGSGSYIIHNDGGTDYFYVYSNDHIGLGYCGGISVSRAPVAAVLAAAKNHTVTSWYKYYNNAWTQPGMNGSFTNLFNPNVQMNFLSVSYNTYINKYILVYTSTHQYSGGNNWSDISLLISGTPLDFYNNVTEYIIDSSTKLDQYPTIVGLGNSCAQTETQKNFYVFYTEWDNNQYWSGGTTALVRKMIVLD